MLANNMIPVQYVDFLYATAQTIEPAGYCTNTPGKNTGHLRKNPHQVLEQIVLCSFQAILGTPDA